MKKPLTILLTGATGYVGSAWLSHPSAKVGKIIALVRDRHKIAPLLASSPSVVLEVQEGSIPSIDPGLLLEGVDIVVHLAAQTGGNDPVQVDSINREWSVRLGKACLGHGVKLLFASTSALYAGQNGELLAEDTGHINPSSLYAKSKYAAEQELLSLAKQGLRLGIVRFASVFGVAPHISFDRAVNKFIQQAVQGEPMVMWRGALQQLRPYTHITDTAAAINFVIEHDLFEGQVYNIVSEHATQQELLEYIYLCVPKPSVALIDKKYDSSFGMDDKKIRALGFVPQGSLKEGIAALCKTLQKDTHT